MLTSLVGKKHSLGWFVLRIMASALVGAVIAGLFVLTSVRRTYSSSASIVFPLASDEGGALSHGLLRNIVSAGTEVPFGSQFPINTYRAVITSANALEKTALQLGLDRFYKLKTRQDIVKFMQGIVFTDVTVDRMLVVSVILPGSPQVMSPSELVARGPSFQRDAAVRRLAPQVVSALITQMGVIADDVKLDSTKANVEALRQQLADTKAQRAKLLNSMVERQAGLGTPDVAASAHELASAIVQRETQVAQFDAEKAGLEKQRSAAQAMVNDMLRNLPALSDDVPLLLEQRRAFVSAEANYHDLALAYGPENTAVVKAKAKLEATQKALNDAVAVAKRGLTMGVMQLDAQLADLRGRQLAAEAHLRELHTRSGVLPGQVSSLAADQADLEALGQSVGDLTQQLQHAEVTYETQGLRWRILDQPLEPLVKTGPRVLVTALLGALVFMLLLNLGALARFHRALLSELQNGDPAPVVEPTS